MTMTDEKGASSKTGNELVAQLQASGALDELFAKIDAGEVEITGSDGLLPALLKTTLERGLQAELTGHRSEEHTSELQSRFDIVCRLLLEKKKRNGRTTPEH